MADTESYFYTLKVDLFTTSVKGDKKLQNGNKRLKVKFENEAQKLQFWGIIPFYHFLFLTQSELMPNFIVSGLTLWPPQYNHAQTSQPYNNNLNSLQS